MVDATYLFIAAAFLLAGFFKDAMGLGLPTISMGLLAVALPPVDAAAIPILPSLLTNVWQMVAGPSLRPILRRLWPMMIAVCRHVGRSGAGGLKSSASIVERAAISSAVSVGITPQRLSVRASAASTLM